MNITAKSAIMCRTASIPTPRPDIALTRVFVLNLAANTQLATAKRVTGTAGYTSPAAGLFVNLR